MPGQQREVEFRFLAEPSDVNFGGKVHGGMVMKWIDQAGYAGAVGWSGQYCVTVAVGGIQFVAPILIGDLVTVRCKLIRTGNSSMHWIALTEPRLQCRFGIRAATRITAWPISPSDCWIFPRRWKSKLKGSEPIPRCKSRSPQSQLSTRHVDRQFRTRYP